MPRDARIPDASGISVLVVDPSDSSCNLMVAGLVSVGQFARVRGSNSVRAARRLAQTHDFNIAIISTVHDKGERAYYFVRFLARQPKPVRSLVIARDWKRANVIEAFRFGAKGLLSPATEVPKICKAIACVMAGQVWANSEQLNHALDYLVGGADGERKPIHSTTALTARERDVAGFLAKGASNKEIAKVLRISERTVKNHLRSVFSKMGVSSRVQAALSLSA